MARTVAFVGLGNMGGPMAANLAGAGRSVRVFDLSPEARDRAVAAGCTAAGDVAGAVAEADAVVTMLPAGPHVAAVYTGDDGVLAHARADALLIDCSTIDVGTARQVAETARDTGRAMVDAPVSGGVAAAQGGALTFMVGGEPDAFAAAEPILQNMGKAVIHAGESGAGQAAKICNNMLLAICMIGTAEAFTLADKLGLDAQTFFDISSKASGQSWSMTSYCPAPGPVPTAPSNRGYQPGFAAAMMLKDLKLAQQAAGAAGAATPLGAQSEALYAMLDGLGAGGMDFSAIITLLNGTLADTVAQA